MTTIYELKKLRNDSPDFLDAQVIIETEEPQDIIAQIQGDMDSCYLYRVTLWWDNETTSKGLWTFDEAMTGDEFITHYGPRPLRDTAPAGA